MRRLHRFGWIALACLVLACATKPADHADLVLLNGNVITVDADDTLAEAIAVRDGRILAVGSSAEINRLAGPHTQRVDLQGLTATPGLLDAHAHFSWGGAVRLHVLDLSYPIVESIEDVAALVAEQRGRVAPGSWIEGRGWDEGKLSERRTLYAADLDAVAPDHPVWLSHTMGHYGVANSRALQLAGISADTPDPPGGTIDRNPDRTPTGLLKETAQALVEDLIPALTEEQYRAGIAAMATEFNREGMTGVKDPEIGSPAWNAYRDVLDRGDLSVRVFALWKSPMTIEETRDLIREIAPFTARDRLAKGNHLISGGIKIYIDGSGGARTAWLYDDWNRDQDGIDEGNRGYPVIDPELLRRQVQLYHDAALHVSIHSIGDRGIDWTVDSFDQTLANKPTVGLRHGIVHANIPTDHALEVMARLQSSHDAAYPEPSATFMWWIGDTYAGNFGKHRAQRLNPFQTFLRSGIQWANGSDYPVTPFPARYGLWASMARETLLGVYGRQPYGVVESVDIQTALRSATVWVARQMFLEDEIGSIEVGKLADIAVWDRDLYRVPAAAIKDLTCQLTLFNGEIVYRHPDAPIAVSGGD